VDVLDLSFRFVTSHAWLHAKVALVVLVPPYALCVWLGASGQWAVAWIGALAQTPFTMLASKLVFQERATAREAIFAALGALPRIFFARVFQALAVVVSCLLCVVPIFFFAPALFF